MTPRKTQLPWPQHWLWLVLEPEYGGLVGFWRRASWRVVYTDMLPGQPNRSIRMPYGEACALARVFRGAYIEKVKEEAE